MLTFGVQEKKKKLERGRYVKYLINSHSHLGAWVGGLVLDLITEREALGRKNKQRGRVKRGRYVK